MAQLFRFNSFSPMTWRIFLYSTLCLAFALVVASATGPIAGDDVSSGANSLLALQALPPPAVADPTRLISLFFGIGAVILTFQKAWKNMRRPL